MPRLATASGFYPTNSHNLPTSHFSDCSVGGHKSGIKMHLRYALISALALIPLCAPARWSAIQAPLGAIFANDAALDFRIPTVAESAAMARRMMRLENIGDLATVFQQDTILESRERAPVPHDLAGIPIGLTEYFADCEPETNNPTILAVNLATAYKNAAAGSNVSLSIRWHIPNPHHHLLLTPAALPRFSLMGHLEKIPPEEVEKKRIAKCFVKAHPEAHIWLPGNDIHFSEFVRLIVDEVYWFGGFGDRSYIGWIPAQTWRNVSKSDWKRARLPGER